MGVYGRVCQQKDLVGGHESHKRLVVAEMRMLPVEMWEVLAKQSQEGLLVNCKVGLKGGRFQNTLKGTGLSDQQYRKQNL